MIKQNFENFAKDVTLADGKNAANNSVSFCFYYKDFAVFIDWEMRKVVAMPKDKIEPDSGLQDDELFVEDSSTEIKLAIDARIREQAKLRM